MARLPLGGTGFRTGRDKFASASRTSIISANVVRPEDYGAKGNLFLGRQATTTGGSPNVTLADAALTNADVGKKVCINNAGTASGLAWTTTISTVTDATHFVAAGNAPQSVSSLYYAYGTDDTPAFIAAVNAGAASWKSFTVLLENVGYMIAGPVQDNGSHTNAQIPLPVGGVVDTGRHQTIEFRGEGRSKAWDGSPQTGDGPILFSSLTTDPWNPAIGIGSIIGGTAFFAVGWGLNATTPIIRDVIILGPHRFGPTMLDFGNCISALVEDCWLGANAQWSAISPHPNWQATCGIVMPQVNNYNDVVANRNRIIGAYFGIALSEHFDGTGNLVRNCEVAIGQPTGWNSYHSSHFGRLDVEACQYIIANVNMTNGQDYMRHLSWTIDELNVEAESGPWAPVVDFNNFASPFDDAYVDIKAASRYLAPSGAFTPGGWTMHNPNSQALRLKDIKQPVGIVTAPSIPASGTAFPLIWRDAIYNFTGGTVSGITVGGTSVGATTGQVYVPSGLPLVLTYTVAPTLTSVTVVS